MMRTVSWLSSSWDLNSSFANQQVRVNQNGPTSRSKTLASSPPVSSFPRKTTCFAFWEKEATSSAHGTPANPAMIAPKLQNVRFQKLPKLPMATRDLMDSCCKSEHLVESPTGETFLVKQYKKTAEIVEGVAQLKTVFLIVFELDEEGNAVYTQDMGDLSMFLNV
ncbi:hypothetical protein Bca4012_025056 [Brassica carinata]